MSSDSVAIEINNVSKCFKVYPSPIDRLKQLIIPSKKRRYEEFWALKNISFKIEKGQTLGIIGQNGSGKSTLLQIIAGIMSPTEGDAKINGKVAALLELGSGFNPEFTGRENVFLNASLFGLTQKQIEAQFDKIAAFADIGAHIEQPVKTYSSGMMMRLAFAVQIAVEPEVLIIDEALAVGDAKFQSKCFRRLEDLKKSGTTILFVSHATDLVRSFCDQVLVLDKGNFIYFGNAETGTTKYLAILFPKRKAKQNGMLAETSNDSASSNKLKTDEENKIIITNSEINCETWGHGGAQLDRFEISGITQPNILCGGDSIQVICAFSWQQDIVREIISENSLVSNITLGITLSDKQGKYLFGCNGFDYAILLDPLNENSATISFSINLPILLAGEYFISLAIAIGNLDRHEQLIWYDNLMEVKIEQPEINVFGYFAVDYETVLLKH